MLRKNNKFCMSEQKNNVSGIHFSISQSKKNSVWNKCQHQSHLDPYFLQTCASELIPETIGLAPDCPRLFTLSSSITSLEGFLFVGNPIPTWVLFQNRSVKVCEQVNIKVNLFLEVQLSNEMLLPVADHALALPTAGELWLNLTGFVLPFAIIRDESCLGPGAGYFFLTWYPISPQW